MKQIQENEIPKYLKQKESDVSKARKKSKHKHQYEECLIQHHFKGLDGIYTSLRSYCTICGKIGEKFKEERSIVKDFRKTIDTSIGKCYQMITNEELYERYHDKLPVFFVENIWKDGYVNLDENEK